MLEAVVSVVMVEGRYLPDAKASYPWQRSRSARLSVQQRCQQCTHTAPVRTLPVNPFAGVAAQEVRVEGANAWRHLRPSQFRADLVQRKVAMKAQAEWPCATRQVEALVQFAQLQRRFQGCLLYTSDAADE